MKPLKKPQADALKPVRRCVRQMLLFLDDIDDAVSGNICNCDVYDDNCDMCRLENEMCLLRDHVEEFGSRMDKMLENAEAK